MRARSSRRWSRSSAPASSAASRSSRTPVASTPPGCAAAARDSPTELGLDVRIAYVEGDDLLPRIDELLGRRARPSPTSTPASRSPSLGMPAAHRQRLPRRTRHHRERSPLAPTSSSPVASPTPRSSSGPAAWWHGWDVRRYLELDRSPAPSSRVTSSSAARRRPAGTTPSSPRSPTSSMPASRWAEVAGDGSSVIGKHDGTGGRVSVGTVTAQLLYEIGGSAVPQPRRDRAVRHHRARAGRAGPRAHHRRAGLRRPPHGRRSR